MRRTGRLLVGLALYAASMALMLRAGLGAMPWDVLHQGIAARTPLSFGTVTAVTGALVLLCWVPLRQRPGFGTVANVLVISAAVDPALAILERVPGPLPWPAQVALLVAGIGVNAVATALYIGADLGPGPRDGLMIGLVRRTGWSVRVVRTAIEVSVVAAGWLLGGTAGVGTVLYALAVGPLVHLLLPRLTVRVTSVSSGDHPGRPAASGAAAVGSGTRA